MFKKLLAVLLACAMILSLAACGGTDTKPSGDDKASEDTKKDEPAEDTKKDEPAEDTKKDDEPAPGGDDEPSDEPGGDAEPTDNRFHQNEDGSFYSGGIKFPLEEKLTVTWYRTADAQLLDLTDGDLNNNTFLQEFEKRTNIHFDFKVPAIGTEQEQFALLFSSNNLPDIISGADNYPDGLDEGIDDGYFMDLTELIPQYMPEYLDIITECEGDVDLLTNSGRYATLAMVYNHQQAPLAGYIIRKDWLDELNLDIPTTFDELEEVLVAFKEKKGCTAPLTFSKFGLFSMSYAYDFMFVAQSGVSYRDGDRIGDALLDYPENVKAYLAKIHDWFERGLLDPNFMSATGYMPDAALMNSGATGVTYAMYSQIETKFQQAVEAGAELVAIPFPKVNKDDVSHMSASAMIGTCVSSCAINAEFEHAPELLAAFNYLFTDPGFMLANYGIEGDTYNVVDGEVVYTDKMLENIADGIRLYTMPTSWGPMYVEPDRQNPAFSDVVQDAQKIWTPDDTAIGIPTNAFTYTPEEQSELSSITADLYTYMEEYFLKAVTGAASLDDFDDFVAQCKKLGLERENEIKNAAFERYLNKGKQ